MSGSEPYNSMRLDFAAAAAAAADGSAVFNNPFPPAASQNYQPSAAAPININGGGAGGESPALAMSQGHVVGSGSESAKKKRGRPRKYVPDGGVALGLAPTSPSAPVVNHSQSQNQSGGGGAVSPPAPGIASASTSSMKKRGRPRGSLNKNHGSAKSSCTAQVITVKAGEDLSSKLMSVSMIGPCNICILSANGTISNVTLRQPASPGGTVTYEGRFEILTLHGSLRPAENGQYNRAGGLSLTLSGPDGRVMGGGVVGVCVAASPIQIVLLSFDLEGRKKSKLANQMENLSAPPKVSENSSPSRGTFSESSGGTGSPLHQSTEACNNNNIPQGGGIPGMPWK